MRAVAVKKTSETLDPLYVIFEQHLYSFQDSDEDRKVFIAGIIAEYITFLRKKQIAVPRHYEQAIVEELAVQVNTMLVKKIYGCLKIADYTRGVQPAVKKRAKSRYSKLARG